MSEFSTVSRETVENCVTFQRKGKESCLNGRNLPERSTPCLWKASILTEYKFLWDAKFKACFSHLVLEKVTERLDDFLEINIIGKSAHIVV